MQLRELLKVIRTADRIEVREDGDADAHIILIYGRQRRVDRVWTLRNLPLTLEDTLRHTYEIIRHDLMYVEQQGPLEGMGRTAILRALLLGYAGGSAESAGMMGVSVTERPASENGQSNREGAT